jgi:hypothetical protein
LVSEICQKNGIQILNYLDDLAGCEEEHYCNFAFDFLGKLLQDCGIDSFFEAIILCIQHSTSKRISVSLFSSIAIVNF